MRYRKEIVTTAATLAIAVGIGFVMQRSQSADTLSADAPSTGGEVLANADAALLNVEDIILTSAEFDTTIQKPRQEEKIVPVSVPEIVPPEDVRTNAMNAPASASAADPLAEKMISNTDTACPVDARARPVAAAMVNLTLTAPCLPNERVTVHHSGLLFNQTTDADGSLDITLPALARNAMFIVAFSDGEGGVAQATVEDVSEFDRVGVQWKGDIGFELHAREYGAGYGDEGHVWSGAARDMSYAVTGQGGYITRLGDPDIPDGLMAEIYTFPPDNAERAGTVDLSVETEVATNNCGFEIEAQTLQMQGGGSILSKDVTLSVPDCEAAGNFLVLNNLFEDLKVAIN
ncbi:hypothetical protein [uncultured Sulfitobacter sp.]|uniref:hypothetical protein n=1 Tax=uncultured Sulfitobacter sp. TaxID=191468 RepID=UPI002607B3D7|nr:hypothetical protein [uncultured Sulfitobacter sp.]